MLDNLCKCGHHAFLHFESAIPDVKLGTGACVRTECDCRAFELPFFAMTGPHRTELSMLLIPIAKSSIHVARAILARGNRGKTSFITLSQTPDSSYESMKAECEAWHRRAQARKDRLALIQWSVRNAELEMQKTEQTLETRRQSLKALKEEAHRLQNDI